MAFPYGDIVYTCSNKLKLESCKHSKEYFMENELKSGLGGFVVRAEKECDVYCPICHKLLHVEVGQVIPRCCGKPMQVLK